MLLDPDHPQAGLKAELREWLQTTTAECFAQLAVYAPGCEALRRDPAVTKSLEAVAEAGLTPQSREFAQTALMSLSDKELQLSAEGQQHVMLSYQWNVQPTIKRVDESLKRRGYETWFDLTNSASSLRLLPLCVLCAWFRGCCLPCVRLTFCTFALRYSERQHSRRNVRRDRERGRYALWGEPRLQRVCELPHGAERELPCTSAACSESRLLHLLT